MFYQLVEIGKSSGNTLAIVAIAVSLLTVFWTMYWNWRTEKRGYIDEFWFRTVLAPLCITPIIDFRAFCYSEIDTLYASGINAATVSAFLATIAKQKHAVLDSVWLSKIVLSSYYGFCSDHLDEIEDEFANILARSLVVVPPAVSPAVATASALKQVAPPHILSILTEAARLHTANLQIAKGKR